ncbi:MAG: peptide methionine sulfoxide reductase, partial [Halobaculum sp.]
ASDFPRSAVETRVKRLSGFTLAEDYHQKYRLRSRRSLLQAFEDASYDDDAIRDSPAAAVANGYAAGHDVGSVRELGLADSRTVR